MNEFPNKYFEVMREASGSETSPGNVGEFLEYLDTLGIREANLPVIQPTMQKRIWDRFKPGSGPEALKKVIDQMRKEDNRFSVEGGSWTNNISWVRGYADVLGPMEQASALFVQKTAKVPTTDSRYRNALFHLLTTQTSCYRYWGQGIWTDYARELCRRTNDILQFDFK